MASKPKEDGYCHCGRRDALDTAVCFGSGFGCPYCGRPVDPDEDEDDAARMEIRGMMVQPAPAGFEDDGCGCKFRYGTDGSFKVLNVCTYHEQEVAESRAAGKSEMAKELLELIGPPGWYSPSMGILVDWLQARAGEETKG